MEVRWPLASNRSTPRGALEKLLLDKASEVRMAALENASLWVK
jgi:hypothetical protein